MGFCLATIYAMTFPSEAVLRILACLRGTYYGLSASKRRLLDVSHWVAFEGARTY